eukprot:3983278-Karenia_brevis.AAC.1
MAAQGWSPQWLKEVGSKHKDHEFLCTLAGRAFSAYTFTPVALATMAAIGLRKGMATGDEVASHSSDSIDGEEF